ncbi:MAG: RICIN domain-containing protein [Rubrivivax sp.]|nr:RICIN domain-containing protein [Rubrivivax sp.]
MGRARASGLALALACMVASAPASAQDTTFGPPGTPFVLRTVGHCLEVNEPQVQLDGARVQLGRCDGRPHQTWRHDRGRLVNGASGRCLDVHGPDAGLDGARVQAVTCSAAPNQQWRLDRGQLVVRVDERCLEAVGLESARPGPAVQTWACNGERAQRWRISALPAPAAPPPAPPPSATTRDVEAGPLFSNAEAARKCPAVCSPGRWNGQWVTTVPGRMSVCGCVFEAPAATPVQPAPPPPPATTANQAMAAERFDDLVRLLDEEAFPANALRTLQTVARDHRFSVEQVRRLFDVFAFGSDRLRALEVTLPRLTDRANAFQLLGAFTFESEKEQARRMLERPSGVGR